MEVGLEHLVSAGVVKNVCQIWIHSGRLLKQAEPSRDTGCDGAAPHETGNSLRVRAMETRSPHSLISDLPQSAIEMSVPKHPIKSKVK